MTSDRIRSLVLGVPRRDDEILVAELYDPATEERFYRPVGGEIEFGERSDEAIVREFREELDVPIEPVEYLGTIENRFRFAGTPGHEIVLVYSVAVADERMAERDLLCVTDDGGTTYEARWRGLDDLETGEVPLYPGGLLRLLRGDADHVIT